MTTPQPFEEDSVYLSDLSPADKPWDGHRSLAQEVAQMYYSLENARYFERISDCSKWLGFALKATTEGELRFKLQDARFCRVRHCPVCQWRRSLSWRARFFKALPRVQEAYPTARWIFLTLTIRNCSLEELRDTVALMNKAWKRLTERKDFPALGFIKSLEVDRSDIGEAHPHFHCLLLVPAGYFARGYISQPKWRELWKSCLRIDYLPQVDIKVVKDRVKVDKPDPTGSTSIDSGMAKALCETLKYSVKKADLISDPEWLEGLTKQLHKTRAIAIGGVLKEYLSEDEPEDLINTDLEEDDEELSESDPRLLFDWAETIRRYKKK